MTCCLVTRASEIDRYAELLESYGRIKTLLSDGPSDTEGHCRRLRSKLETRTADFTKLLEMWHRNPETRTQSKMSCGPCGTMSRVRRSLQIEIPPEVRLPRSDLMREINRFDELAAIWAVSCHKDALRLSEFVSEYMNSLTAVDKTATASYEHRFAKPYPPQIRNLQNAALTGMRSGRKGPGQGLLSHSDEASSCYLCSLAEESAFAQTAGLLRAVAHKEMDSTEIKAAVMASHLNSIAEWATWTGNRDTHSRLRSAPPIDEDLEYE